MWRPLLLGVAFLISGASALVFETLWFHQASIALGSSAWSASLVLSAFMAGMACGNWLAARRAAGVECRKLGGIADDHHAPE